jgi:putative spermidine/putrescine transport system ATP-binding protein
LESDLSQPLVSLTGVSKFFGEVHAVVDLNLAVNPGEFFSMLGPSGSGKTTVLRLIASFKTVSTAKITIADSDVTDLAPFDQPVNTLFRYSALFPHMSI